MPQSNVPRGVCPAHTGRTRPRPWPIAVRLAVLLLLVASAPEAASVTYRWSESSYRIYVAGPGSARLSDVKAAMPNAPLEQVAPGVWHLRANLVAEKGARLVFHGTRIGGDVNELRMQSNNTGESNAFVHITADWGVIDIRSTKITSWDDAVNGPDTEYGALRRAFIRARSSLAPDGVTPLESRMDVIDSDVGYLGSHDPEAYGIVWKVIENPTNAPYGAITNLYNLVNVYGDILRSRLHHNYFGMYSYGSFGMQMRDNELDHNVTYGFDPHDDSDWLVIENNNVHHNGTHGIIASQRCNNLIIRENVSWNNGGNGIMLHRYCDDSLVENNRCLNNGDSGVALFDTKRATVRNNICLGSFNAGIRLSVGAADNLVENNEFGQGANFGIYLYKGNDRPFPGDDGHPKRNRFVNNFVHDNANSGVFSKSGDDNLFAGNLFVGNVGPFWLVDGKRNRFESNSIPRETLLRQQASTNNGASSIMKDQAAIWIQVDAFSTTTFEDPAGAIFDPEEPGIATTVTPTGSRLVLTTVEIFKDSFVRTRPLHVVPDAGTARITITAWNTVGSYSKRWLTQASSTTRRITYRVGDLNPNTRYRVFKNGSAVAYTSDAQGVVTFHDTAISTAIASFEIML